MLNDRISRKEPMRTSAARSLIDMMRSRNDGMLVEAPRPSRRASIIAAAKKVLDSPDQSREGRMCAMFALAIGGDPDSWRMVDIYANQSKK